MTTLHLVRHAQPGGDGTLSDRGREQARLLGVRLAGLGAEVVLHGPAVRTAQTAQVLGLELAGVPVHESARLADLTPTPGPGEGNAYPPRLRGWLESVAPRERDPGGVRLSEAFGYFAALPGAAVLVTHAFVIGWFVRTAIGAPTARWMELFPDHAGLTTLVFRDDDRPPALTRFNDTGHLG